LREAQAFTDDNIRFRKIVHKCILTITKFREPVNLQLSEVRYISRDTFILFVIINNFGKKYW